MKLIPLTQGQFAQVDDEDYDYLMQFKWSFYNVRRKRYAVSNDYSVIPKKTLRMHRMIMKEDDPKVFIDHKDHDGLNNQKSNLRKCTSAENSRNGRSRLNSTSKFLGVYLDKRSGKYRCSIKNNTTRHSSIRFETEIEAALAYDSKAKELHGEFANLNFKD